MKKNKRDVQESLDFIIDNMATRSDIGELKNVLNEHTRDLNVIKNNLKTNLDQRKQLEVRVTKLEQKVR